MKTLRIFTLWIHVYNPLQVGLQAWFATTMSSTTQNSYCSHDWSTPAFHHSSRLLLAEAESPPHFFFSFRCNDPSRLCSSIVCISIFYPCTLLMYRSSLKLIVSLWWVAETLPQGLRHWWMVLFWTFNMLLGKVALVELFFYFHVLRRCWYSVSWNVLL